MRTFVEDGRFYAEDAGKNDNNEYLACVCGNRYKAEQLYLIFPTLVIACLVSTVLGIKFLKKT
jgi:hypothetical protein